MPMKFCWLLLLPLLVTCKALIKSDTAAMNARGCAYIQKKEQQLFAQASRLQDTLLGMLDEFNASAEEYEKKTGNALSFLDRQSKGFQEFLVTHQEKTTNFRALQDELHKVFGKLQTVNMINYSHCPNNQHLEIDGMNYGLLKDKKPASCANYQNEIAKEKGRVAELEKVFTVAEKDILFDAGDTDKLSAEADKLQSLSNKILYTFIGSETITFGMMGGYAYIYRYLGTATPIAIAGIEAADFVLSLAWIYTSTKTSDLRLEAQRLRSKYQLTGIDNKMVLKELNKLNAQINFLEDIFRNFCRKG